MSSTCTSDVDFGKITKTSNNASEAPTATATAKNETDNDADMEGHSCSGRRESLLKYARCVVLGAKWSTFAILVAVLFAQGIQCLRKFAEHPTYISTFIAKQQDAKFPAVTVCPEKSSYKLHVLQAHGISDASGYNSNSRLPSLEWAGNKTDVLPDQLFRMATWDASEVFDSIKLRSFLSTDNGSFLHYPIPPNGQSRPSPIGAMLEEQRHRKFGRCYTFHPAKWLRRLGIYYINMKFNRPSKMYLHRKGQFLDFNGRMGHKVDLGQRARMQVAYQDIRTINKESWDPHRKCTDDECMYDECTYDECMYRTLTELMLNSTGEERCTVPWVFENRRVCRQPDNVRAAFTIAYSRITNQEDDCAVPCDIILAQIGAKEVDEVRNSSRGEVTLYFPARVVHSEERLFYSVLSLLAEIGGYVGLLLGVSLLQVASLCTSFLERQILRYGERDGGRS